MNYDLMRLTAVLALATLPLMFVSQIFLAGIRRSASKHLVNLPIDQVTTIQRWVRPAATAAAALDIDLNFPSMQAAAI